MTDTIRDSDLDELIDEIYEDAAQQPDESANSLLAKVRRGEITDVQMAYTLEEDKMRYRNSLLKLAGKILRLKKKVPA